MKMPLQFLDQILQMNNELVKINCMAFFGEKIGKEFNLAVDSVSEAFHAINVLTDNGWSRLRMETVNDNLRYNILINENEVDLNHLNHLTLENVGERKNTKLIENSELLMYHGSNFKSMDVVPVTEGGMGWFVVAAIIVTVVSTVIQLALMKPPKFEDFRKLKAQIVEGRVNLIYFQGPKTP